MKFSHCHECGTEYSELSTPRTCAHCGHIKWFNPNPVVIVLQPVDHPCGGPGLVIAKRGIEPKKGEWALVGGFIEMNEPAEIGAAREFREETGLELGGPARVWFTDVTTAGHLMIVCVVDTPITFEAYAQAKPCVTETEELGVLYKGSEIELAFPIHQKAVREYFGAK